MHSLTRIKPRLQPHTGHSENDDATNMRGGIEKQNEMVNSHEGYFLFPYALLLNNKNFPQTYGIIWAVSKGSIITILFFFLSPSPSQWSHLQSLWVGE